MVITRQRPGTAKGFVFLTLEDETGISNIIIRPDLYATDRLIVVESSFLLVEGVLQNQDGVTSIKAERMSKLDGMPTKPPSTPTTSTDEPDEADSEHPIQEALIGPRVPSFRDSRVRVVSCRHQVCRHHRAGHTRRTPTFRMPSSSSASTAAPKRPTKSRNAWTREKFPSTPRWTETDNAATSNITKSIELSPAVALPERALNPNSNFTQLMELARTLFHENIHSNHQGFSVQRALGVAGYESKAYIVHDDRDGEVDQLRTRSDTST